MSPVAGKVAHDPEPVQWGYSAVGAPKAWDISTGSSDVIVAIIDDGFDANHPDIADNVWVNKDEIPDNGIDDDNNGYVDDVKGWNFVPTDLNNSGTIDAYELMGNNDPRPSVLLPHESDDEAIHHGTLVAGIIGARGDNNIGSTGLNWHIQLMNIKVLGNTGVSTDTLHYLPRAIQYAVDNGADIINFSLVTNFQQSVADAIQYAYDHQVAVVAAVGNDGAPLEHFPRFPACLDAFDNQKILGVSAVTETFHSTDFTNFGSACVDIAAPGEDITSTVRYAPQFGLQHLVKGGWAGTSFAAPFVSGAAALVKSVHPEWGPEQLYKSLLTTTHKTPTSDEKKYANYFGAGLLQVDKAVEYAATHSNGSFSLTDGATFYRGNVQSGLLRTVIADVPVFDDAEVFFVDGDRRYATVRQTPNKTSDVTIYSHDWKPLTSWSVAGTGPFHIAVGDFDSTLGDEIIISPQFADKTLFTVYTLEGAKLGAVTTSKKHRGVKLSVMHNRNTNHDQLVVLFFQDKQLILAKYTSLLSTPTKQIVPSSYAGWQNYSADIDNDGTAETVFVSPHGAISVVDIHGAPVMSLTPYESYRGKVSTALLTNSDDSSTFILLAPEDGAQNIKAYSVNGQLAGEWEMPKTKHKHAIHIFAE